MHTWRLYIPCIDYTRIEYITCLIVQEGSQHRRVGKRGEKKKYYFTSVRMKMYLLCKPLRGLFLLSCPMYHSKSVVE